jgi:hypothetical protein
MSFKFFINCRHTKTNEPAILCLSFIVCFCLLLFALLFMFFIGHDVETLTPPAAPLSLLQSQKGEGAEFDGGRTGRGGRM